MNRMFFNTKTALEFLRQEGFKRISASAYIANDGRLATMADCKERGVYVSIA